MKLYLFVQEKSEHHTPNSTSGPVTRTITCSIGTDKDRKDFVGPIKLLVDKQTYLAYLVGMTVEFDQGSLRVYEGHSTKEA